MGSKGKGFGVGAGLLSAPDADELKKAAAIALKQVSQGTAVSYTAKEASEKEASENNSNDSSSDNTDAKDLDKDSTQVKDTQKEATNADADAISDHTPVDEISEKDSESAEETSLDFSALLDVFKSQQAQLEQQQKTIEDQRKQISEIAANASEKEAALAELSAEQAEKDQAVSVLAQLTQLSGQKIPPDSMPNLIKHTNPLSKGPSGDYKAFCDAFDSAPSTISGHAHEATICRDPRGINAVLKSADVDAIKRGLEKEMQDNGLLSGGVSSRMAPANQTQKAATTIHDLSGQFLPRLSAIMRLSNVHQYVFHLCVAYEYAFGLGQGTTVEFMRRGSLLQKSKDPTDRLLSSGGIHIPVSANLTPLQTATVPAVLKRWGLGKVGFSNPIAWTEFVERYSLDSLVNHLNLTLRDDYLHWRDLAIRAEFQKTSRVFWNKRGAVTSNRAGLVAGDDCRLTHNLITAISMELETMGVPKLNGYYMMVVPSTVIAGYAASLDESLRLANTEERQLVRSIVSTHSGLADTSGLESQLVSGLVGIDGNMILMRTNAYGTGTPGTDGTQSEAIAGGTLITRSCYAFGDGAVGRGVGMPFEIRTDVSPYGLSQGAIWVEDSVTVALDVDRLNSDRPNLNPSTGEQTRVLEVRVTEGVV